MAAQLYGLLDIHCAWNLPPKESSAPREVMEVLDNGQRAWGPWGPIPVFTSYVYSLG